MSKEHPITPPPELVRQWDEECESGHNPEINNTFDALKCFASKAAQWGADQELEACCHLLRQQGFDVVEDLRAARRPKPPSLKEQALAIVCRGNQALTTEEQVTIRRALEQLDD